MFYRIINSKSKTFLAFCFSFLLGVAVMTLIQTDLLGGFKQIPSFLPYPIALLLASTTMIIIFWQDPPARFFSIIFFCFMLGVTRYISMFPNEQHVSRLNGHSVVLEGYIDADPDVRTDGVRYIVQIINHKSEIKNQRLTGQVYVKSGLYPRYNYGDRLVLRCDLETPQPIADKNNPDAPVFRYDMYLARYGVFSLCQHPTIKQIGAGEGQVLLRSLLRLKDAIADHLSLLWSEPYAAFMGGLLYGYRGGLGVLNDEFQRAGVTHIVAISGFNISIIATALMTIFIHVFYIRRQHAFYVVIAGITLFILMTGASGSAVRAGIMAFLVLLARQIGRLSRMANMLLATAAVMILWNPLMLFWDAGFQLSFLSTLGIVYLTPVFEQWVKRIPQTKLDWLSSVQDTLTEAFVTTMAAIIGTLPLILFQFGRLSIVAPVVNVLILWLVPWLMLLGFVAVVGSFVLYSFGTIIAMVAFWGMKYIVGVVDWFSGLPFAAIDVRLPWWGMIGLYVLLFFYTKSQYATHEYGTVTKI